MTASSRAAGRSRGAVGWVRLCASTAAKTASRRLAHGMARVFLGCAKAARRQAWARTSPRQEIGSCETGLSWGMLWIVTSQSFPALGRMFMARPHRRALAFLGFWVQQAPCGTPRIGGDGRSPCTTESRRSKGGLVRNLRAPAGELGVQANSISQRATPATWDASTRDPSQEPIDQTLNERDILRQHDHA